VLSIEKNNLKLLEELISEKLMESHKTLLLLGNSGAGKSKYSKMLAYQLLEKFDKYNIYPIHVKLSSFNYKEKLQADKEVYKLKSLKDILISKRINEEMINFLKKKKTLLIFDGVDEVPCKLDIMKYL
jgi:adenylate kinase family enzyme